MRAFYSTTWDSDSRYLNQGAFQGYQDWTVPVSGTYTLDVRGAAGYEGTGSARAGHGARITGTVTLTKGEIITIVVGQRGEAPTTGTIAGGSGGGTFVVRKAGDQPLIIAGGGSADFDTRAGNNGVLTTEGGRSSTNAAGGVDGGGGSSGGGRSGGGGGFNSRGGDTLTPTPPSAVAAEKGGGSFRDGLLAADNGARIGGNGGFGGGGSTDGTNEGQSGGAGGYSGGAGGRTLSTSDHVGGGGGSFISPLITNVGTSTGTYETISTFGGVPITNLASYNSGDGGVIVTLVNSFTTGNELYPTAPDAQAGTNKIAIAPTGSSFHALVPINYDDENNKIYSTSVISFITGDAVSVNFTNAAPAGLLNGSTGQIYYINKLNNYTYQLSLQSDVSSTINLGQPSARDISPVSSISKVIVNTTLDTLTISNHGFLVNQPLKYDTGGETAIEPLVDQTTYYISEVIDANTIKLKAALNSPTPINFTAPGTGTSHSFLFLTVNAVEDTLYIPNHGLVNGQAVRYSNNGSGNVSIPGLVDNTTYFVIKVDNSIIKLASNAALTNVVNISATDPWPATGTHSLFVVTINYTTNTLTIPSHGFSPGELVLYNSAGQTVINGLSSGTPYYVIFVDGDNLKLATTPENATAGTAVDLTNSPLGVGRHTLQSLTRTPDGIYTIESVPTPDTFTVAARGSVPVISKVFNPRATIDTALDSFFIPSHGFITGTKVKYLNGESATDISGLEDDTDYYTVTLNKDYIRLAESQEEAASGVTLTISGYGTGVAHSLTSSQINGNLSGGGTVSVVAGSVLVNGTSTSFSKILKVGDKFRLFPDDITVTSSFIGTGINTSTNIITSTNTFTTGDTVKYAANGGTATPLVDGYYYFVRRLSGTEVTLHSSSADATAGINEVSFSSQGTGSSFTLTKTTPVAPIIRTITAVGSDTQLTVDRPYASAYTDVSYSYPTFVYVRPQGYSLHRPFDGGVEMSVGAKTSLGQIVRQTRKYFRYQSGKGIQTSAGINFKPSIDIESMVKTSDTTIQCRTRRPHGLLSGLFVRINGALDSFGNVSLVYNGDFTVTVGDNLNTFTISRNMVGQQDRAYGFPQFFVREWTGGALRSGMFDFQNGMFFEFDGQDMYCVRRSSTQQLAGTVSALQGSELLFGTNTSFEAQLTEGDYVVLRGQSYRVVDIESDTRMSVRPEYKGSTGIEKEFNPATSVDTDEDLINILGHGFSNLLPVTYNSIDGVPIGGLINGRTYYVDITSEGAGSNAFRLLSSPDSETPVVLSSVGTTTVHSFTPAKSGIIVTKTVDTKIPQEDWSIDPLDGSGVTGYNLDLSRIQMIYIDYSWYGAGKIRFGFKTADGQVQYVHEFVHNNNLYESYFRSGNLPARYEVVTFENPTYIPFLFHWGTSVMMDGRFDDDNAYLFTEGSQTLSVEGTTVKAFDSSGINLTNDLMTVQAHSFRTGDILEFESRAANGQSGVNSQHPATTIVGSNTLANLTNNTKYRAFVNSANLIHLTPLNAVLTLASTQVIQSAQEGPLVTITTTLPHGLTTGMYAGIYNSPRVSNGAYTVTRVSDTVFTYVPAVGTRVRVNLATAVLDTNVARITTSIAHGLVVGDTVVIAGATNSVFNGTYTITTVPTSTSFTYARTNANIALAASAGTASISVPTGTDTGAAISEVLNFTSLGNTQYTYFLYPDGSLNNTSGPNYQPLISLRLSPSVSEGLTGKLGDRDVINRMQLRLKEIGVSTNELVDVKLLLNPRLNNLNFTGVNAPSLTQIVQHTAADTVSGGVQVYNFRASGASDGGEQSTTVSVAELFELSNSILGGDSVFPDGPDILTVAVSRLTDALTLTSAKMSWSEAQA